MAKAREPRVPDGIDVRRPSVARIYDYLLFGKDNFVADREAAEKLMQSRMEPRRHALANRAFLVRAVRFLAEQGISQYIDLGSGLPTTPSVHEIAREVLPGARVVYVDHDPIVVTHNDALLATNDGVATIRADLREPKEILSHPRFWKIIDFSEPVAVLLVSVLHFISDEEDPPGIIAQFRDRMSPGSYLTISAGTTEGAVPEMITDVKNTYEGARAPFTLRSRAAITGLFDGFDLVEPGLVSPTEWHPDELTDRTPLTAPNLAAIGKLRT